MKKNLQKKQAKKLVKHLKMEEMVEGMQEVMVVMLVESEVKNDKIQMLIQPCYVQWLYACILFNLIPGPSYFCGQNC